MRHKTSTRRSFRSSDDRKIRSLYRELLESWNERHASRFANFFVNNGNVVGFDGSQMNGKSEIESVLGRIFADHVTATYGSIIRDLRFVSLSTAILRAVVGMVPRGQSDINPTVNAIQTLVAAKQRSKWHIEAFQNTPAALHGQPEASAKLTEELRQMLLGSR